MPGVIVTPPDDSNGGRLSKMMGVSSSPSSVGDRQPRYWREISAALALKALGLGLIYLLFFGPSNSMVPSAATMFHHLMPPAGEDISGTIHD